jgi:hypothetical protein
MKEITRRLYTKPVMIGMALLVGLVLVAGLFVTTKSEAQSGTFIQFGDDKFETTGNGETYHNFGASKIPADFFGPGSQEYSGTVPLVGVPLPGQGDIDTIVHRDQSVLTPGTTTIRMTDLSLKGINAITVTFSNGSTTWTEEWNVAVGLSTLKASTGTMFIDSNGTFDSTLKVWPKFTFTRNGVTLVLDTGDPNGPGLTAISQPGVMNSAVFEPAPEPIPTVAPCPIVVGEFEPVGDVSEATTSAAASSCAPVTLTSNNNPWVLCGNQICIPRPITEAELLAAHNASPPGTKKKILAVKQVGIATP